MSKKVLDSLLEVCSNRTMDTAIYIASTIAAAYLVVWGVAGLAAVRGSMKYLFVIIAFSAAYYVGGYEDHGAPSIETNWEERGPLAK